MILRTDIMAGNKHSADVFRNFLDVGNAALFGDALHQSFAVKASSFQLFFENRVHFKHLCSIHDISYKHITEDWFDS